MRKIRSFLFVPATQPTWLEKAVRAQADAIILDLEDSVAPDRKDEGRASAVSMIADQGKTGVRLFARVNTLTAAILYQDLLAVCIPGLEGIILPKTTGPEDVAAAAKLVADCEESNGLSRGSICIIPTLEDARGLHFAYECALSDRVPAIIGAVARDADVSRSVGFQWTAEGVETLYLRSRVVLAARAAGKFAIGGLWQLFKDVEGMTRSAQENRRLGFSGELAIHPASIPVLNVTYGTSKEEQAYYRKMIEAYESSIASGQGSCLYNGEHIDAAHIKTAKFILS